MVMALLPLQFPLRVQVSIRYAYFEEDADAPDCNIPATLVVAPASALFFFSRFAFVIPPSFGLQMSIPH